MANNFENKNKGRLTKESLVEGLTDVAIPMDLTSATFTTDTNSLGDAITDLIQNTYNIGEIDHVFVYPVQNTKTRELETFGVAMYFNTGKTGEGNISRIGGGKTSNNRGNGPDLVSFISNKTQSGGFRMTPEFKEVIGTLSILDRDGNIVVRPDNDAPQLAIIEGDFFRLVAMIMKVRDDEPYDFTIESCVPMNNRKDCIDYKLKISKEIIPMKRKSKKSSYNYDYRDRQIMQSMGRR